MGILKVSVSCCVYDVVECFCELVNDWIKFFIVLGDINVNKYDLQLFFLKLLKIKMKKKMCLMYVKIDCE